MTEQEAYESIRSYFTREGAVLAKRKPVDAEEAAEFGVDEDAFICQYRLDGDAEGPGCAVGCLIPNDLYDRSIEMLPVGGLLRQSHSIREHLGITDADIERWGKGMSSPGIINFLSQAQNAHDAPGNETAAHFVLALDELAYSVGLEVVA